jgi:hypothetical protein
MLVGIVPWRHVDSINNDCRLLSRPMVVGRAPLMVIFRKCKIDKFDREPIVEGMEPRIYTCIYV